MPAVIFLISSAPKLLPARISMLFIPLYPTVHRYLMGLDIPDLRPTANTEKQKGPYGDHPSVSMLVWARVSHCGQGSP